MCFFHSDYKQLEGVGKINPHFTLASSKITSQLGFMIAALSNIFHIQISSMVRRATISLRYIISATPFSLAECSVNLEIKLENFCFHLCVCTFT